MNFIFEASWLNRTANEGVNVPDRAKPASRGGCSRVKHDCNRTKFPQNSKIQICVHRTTSTSRSDVRNPPNISNLSLPCRSSQLIVRLFEADPSLSDSCLVLMRKRFERDIGNACSCMNDILKRLDEPLIKQLRLNCEIRPGRVDFNLSCNGTDGTANRNKTRWFLGRVPTCSNVHKRDSRRELVERCCGNSNDRGSTRLLAEKFEEPRVASLRSISSARDSMERQIRRNETRNENEREVNFAWTKQVDFVLSSRAINSQDDKDIVVERSEKCDNDDDGICEGEIDGSRLPRNGGKEETIMERRKAEETVDVNERSEVGNDGFIVDDSEKKLIELYDPKCGCSSDSLKGDGSSTTEDNLEECSRHAFCTGDGTIEHDRSRTKNVGKDRPCHAFCTSGGMIEHSSNNFDNKGSKVSHCHVICMNDRMVEHSLSRMKTTDDKNSKADRPCRVPCTSDGVVERNSSRTRNLDNVGCHSKENTSRGQESTLLREKRYDSKPEDHVSTGVSGLRTGRELLVNEERVFQLKQGVSQMKDTPEQEIHVFDLKVRERDISKVDEKHSADSVSVLSSNTEGSRETKCSCCGEDIDETNEPFVSPDSITEAENALRRSAFIVESNVSPTRDPFATSEKISIDLSIGDTFDRNERSPIAESLFVFCQGSKRFSSADEESSSNENCRANGRESRGKFKSPCGGSVPAACRRKSIYSVTCGPSCATRDRSRVDRNVGRDRSRRRREKDGASIVSRCKSRWRRGSTVPGSLCSFPAVDRIKYLIRKKLRKLLVEERDKGTSTSKTFLRNDRYLVSVSSGKLNDSRIARESCVTAGSAIRCPFTTRNRHDVRGSPDRTFNEGSCLGKNKNILGDIARGGCQRMIRGNGMLKKIAIGDVSRPLGQKRDSKSTDTKDLMDDGGERAERSKRKGKNKVDPPWCNKNRKSRNGSSVVSFDTRRMVFFEDDRGYSSRRKHDSKGRDGTKNPPAESKSRNYSGGSYEYENGRGSSAEGVACRDKLRSFERRLSKLEKRREEEDNFAALLSNYERRVNELDADFRLKLLQYVTLCRSVKNSLMKRFQPDDAYGVTSSSA